MATEVAETPLCQEAGEVDEDGDDDDQNLLDVNNLEYDQVEHENFCQLVKSKFKNIIMNEPLLSDLDPNLSLAELREILSLEHGDSMKIFIRRADDQVFGVIVKLDSSLKDLKETIRVHFERQHAKSNFPKVVNWKYVWQHYGLQFENEKLVDDEKQLRDHGVKNKCELTFYKIACKKTTHKKQLYKFNKQK